MARITKDPDVRREELLDEALRLFVEKGFDRTSVEDITSASDVAKGTFYHYFGSKQDLLEQLVESFTAEVLEQLDKELQKTDDDAVSRLRALFVESAQWKLKRREVAMGFGRALYMDENESLRLRMLDRAIDLVKPLMAEIIEQGVREGVFDVADPDVTAELSLVLWYADADRIGKRLMGPSGPPEDSERLATALRALENAQERILGLPDGTLGIGIVGYVSAMTDPDRGLAVASGEGAKNGKVAAEGLEEGEGVS